MNKPISVKDTWLTNDSFFMQMHVYPNALYYGGINHKTYFVYLDTTPATWTVNIRAYNHKTRAWGTATQLGTVTSIDAHMSPSIGVLPNGKLIVFYGAHSSTPIYYRVSTNVENETAWGNEQTLVASGLGWTYPQPCSFSDKLVLFARDSVSATQSRWLYNTTTDGSSWTGWIEVVNFGNGYGPYFLFHKIGSNTIICSGFNYHFPGFGTTGSQDLYFAYSADEGATWKEADGSAITLPIDEDQLIVNSGVKTGDTFSLVDEDYHPVVMAFYIVGQENVDDGVKRLCQYSKVLGEGGGSWTLYNAQDEDGSDLTFPVYSTSYPYLQNINGVNSLCYIGNPASSYNVSYYQRVQGSNNRFKVLYTDGEVTVPTTQFLKSYAVKDAPNYDLFRVINEEESPDGSHKLVARVYYLRSPFEDIINQIEKT